MPRAPFPALTLLVAAQWALAAPAATEGRAQTVELTMAEVALHDRAEDCWLVIDGAVHDVTAFIAGHPGGEAITRGCGKDASRFFNQRGLVKPGAPGGHSEAARAMLVAFRLGALGETVSARTAPPPAPHAHDLRARGRWVGLLANAETSPPWSLDVHVKHHLVTDPEQRSRIGVVIGVGLWSWLDLQVGDVTGDGVSHLEARARVLDRSAPVALSISAGAEFLRSEEPDPPAEGEEATPEIDRGPPSIYVQAAAERTAFDRLLALRLNVLGAVQPGFDEGLAVGLGLELRPDPLYGLFAEGIAPLLDDPTALPVWCVGARIYTQGHHFGLYIASSPTASVTPLANRPPDGVAAGFSLARAFAF